MGDTMAKHTAGPWVWRWKSGSLHQVGTDRQYGATVLAPTYSYDEGVGIDVLHAINGAFRAMGDALASGRNVVIPADGLGTGLAELPTRAPKLYAMIEARIAALEEISE